MDNNDMAKSPLFSRCFDLFLFSLPHKTSWLFWKRLYVFLSFPPVALQSRLESTLFVLSREHKGITVTISTNTTTTTFDTTIDCSIDWYLSFIGFHSTSVLAEYSTLYSPCQTAACYRHRQRRHRHLKLYSN